MEPFSKRNKIKKEYSGYGEASIGLRNRLLQLHGHPYSGDEFHFGTGNTNWIHEKAFDKDLQMHFGRKVSIETFRDETQTPYYETFDFIEIYYKRALVDLDYSKRKSIYANICSAFINSGSVYEFNEDGKVILKLDTVIADKITKVDTILEPLDSAREVYRDCIDGLITRSKAPKNIVGDMYIVFEEYSKKATKQKTFDKAIQYLQDKLNFHPTQIQIIKKLKAYRGDVWGAAHAGNSPKPAETEALWYLNMVLTQLEYINGKTMKS